MGKLSASKLLINNNEDLKKEIKVLKRTIKSQQNAYEVLRTKHIDLDKTYSILDNNTKLYIIPEIGKILISILIGLFTNLLSSDIKNNYLWFINILLVIFYVGIIIYQRLKNKK